MACRIGLRKGARTSSCPYAGTIRIRFKGFPRHQAVSQPLSAGLPLESATVSGRFGSRVKPQIPDTVRVGRRYTPASRSLGEGPHALVTVRHLVIFAALVLAGCSNFAPFETQTPNLGPGGQREQTAQEMVAAAGASPANA